MSSDSGYALLAANVIPVRLVYTDTLFAFLQVKPRFKYEINKCFLP